MEDNVGEESVKKVSMVDWVIFIPTALGVDLLEVISTFAAPVPVMGQILFFASMVLSFIYDLIIQFYLFMRGIKSSYQLAALIFELIPGLEILPVRSAVMVLTFYLANHPEKTAILNPKILTNPNPTAKLAQIGKVLKTK